MTNKSLARNFAHAHFYLLALIILTTFVFIDQISGFHLADQILQNVPHTLIRNVFLINYTFMGDTFFAIGLMAAFYFHWKNKDAAIHLLCSFLISVLVIQILKNYFYNGPDTVFFEQGSTVLFPDEDGFLENSFSPSMHATMAFMMATSLSLNFKLTPLNQISAFFTATGIACSRVYLAEQQVGEIYAGALIGFAGAMFVYLIQIGALSKTIQLLLNYRKTQKTNAGHIVPA